MVLEFFKFINKLLAKLCRVTSGMRIYYLIRSRRLSSSFNIQKLRIDSTYPVFNFSSIQKNGQYFGAAREFVNAKDILRREKYFITSFGNYSDSIQLVELDVEFLRGKISGFVRLEDLRLLFVENKVFAIGVCIIVEDRNHPRKSLRALQMLVTISDNSIDSFKVLESGRTIEKNWCLLDFNHKKARFVYSLVPFQLIDVDLHSTKTVEFYNMKPMFTVDIRNSTNFLTHSDFILGIGHRTIDLGYDYVYIHFFIKISEGMVFRSEYFVFKYFSKEFAMNLSESSDAKYHVNFSNHEKGNFVATFSSSVLDKISWSSLSA